MKNEYDLNILGNLLRRLNDEREDALFGDDEMVDVALRLGTRTIKCRIVGVYLDFSSSKEKLRIDLSTVI